MPDSPDHLPQGLVFSGDGDASTPPRWPFIVVITVTIAGGALIWPIYPLVPAVEPYVLGLPFSFAWVVGWMGIVFVVLLLLYWRDERGPTAE